MPVSTRSLRLLGRSSALLLGGLAVLLAALSVPAANPAAPPYRADRVLVAFKEKAPLGARLRAAAVRGLTPSLDEQNPYFASLRLDPATAGPGAVKAAVASLRRDPSVRIVEPDYLRHVSAIPNDPRFGEQANLQNTRQTGGASGADIDAPGAWNVTTGSTAVLVGVVDTGVDYNHPDLRDNILRDARGRVVGYDFANRDTDPMDDNGHGTHVSGILGARGNNRVGISGVAPVVRIMPLKAFDREGSAAVSNLAAAFDYARERGVQLLNSSYGNLVPSQIEREAVQRARDAGILVCVAAGNEGADNDTLPQYPASYNRDLENVIAVGATDDRDFLAEFSNYGQGAVDIAAPGVNVLSTLPGNQYDRVSGTSMATPHVTGVAALIKARYPSLSLTELRARLLGGADHPDSLSGLVLSGRLNAARALENEGNAPGAPSGLVLTHRGETSLRLAWIASGDDGGVGRASLTEVRYSRAPITAANFAQASRAAGVLPPGPAGQAERHLLTGLEPGAEYYVALRTLDNAGNNSPLATAGPFTTLPETGSCSFQDDVEGVPAFTGEGSWAVTTEHHFSGSRSYTDSPGGAYGNGRDASLVQNGPITAAGPAPFLSFAARTDLENGFDFLYAEASVDGGASWHRLTAVTGVTPWTVHTVSLLPFRDRSVRFRFRLVTDDSLTADGVWVDDIRVCSRAEAVCLLEDDVESSPRFAGEGSWTVSTERSFSPSHGYTDSPGGNYRNNRNLSLTQTASVTLVGLAPELHFWAQASLELYYDFLAIEASADEGLTWRRLDTLTGQHPPGFHSVPLTGFAGQPVRVRFRLTTDSDTTRDGVWLDDIRICGERLVAVENTGAGAAPTPPAGLQASAPSGERVVLTWLDRSEDETNFRIERAPAGGSFEAIGAVGPGTQSYTDTSVSPLSAYVYRVRASNLAGDSTPTDPVTVTTPGMGRLQVAGRVDFSRVRVRRQGTRSLTVQNLSATENLIVQIAEPRAPFSLPAGTLQGVIRPGSSARVRLLFRPTRRARSRGTLVIRSSDPNRPSVSVLLLGQGT